MAVEGYLNWMHENQMLKGLAVVEGYAEGSVHPLVVGGMVEKDVDT